MSLKSSISSCDKCKLRTGCNRVIPGSFIPPSDQWAVIISDAPGWQDDASGEVFSGRLGESLNLYLRLAGIPRYRCHVTNVIKCPIVDKDRKRKITTETAKFCGDLHLTRELEFYKPKLVITAGHVASKYILDNDFQSMEADRGIPRTVKINGRKTVVIPVTNPSRGLTSQPAVQLIREDFKNVYKYRKGIKKAVSVHKRDKWKGKERYDLCNGSEEVWPRLFGASVIAVDTEAELDKHGNWIPWSLQFSTMEGQGYMILAGDKRGLTTVAERLSRPEVTTVIHNAAFDLPVMRDMGIVPHTIHDSLIAARIIQTVPRGLKSLAWRFAGMKMDSYNNVTGSYIRDIANEYLRTVLENDYPPCEPVEEMRKDKDDDDYYPYIKQPQHIAKKAERIIFDSLFKNADPYERWNNIKWEEGRGMVEEKQGPMPRAWLSNVPFEDALTYACRDADATLRVYPYICKLLAKYNLWDTFTVDMESQKLVTEMERCGMPVNGKMLRGLKKKYTKEMTVKGKEINAIAGHYVNPASWKHVSELLYEEMDVPRPEKWKDKNSTNAKYLRPHAEDFEVIKHILDWRGCRKIDTSYIDPLLFKADNSKDGRVRASLQVTGTLTGRMTSNNPNLLAMPTRTEKGTEIRKCFRARKNCVIIHADYGKMDFCIMAHASKDPEMTRIFREGQDIHQMTAHRIFGVPPDKQDKYLHRLPAKTVGFGVAFGLTAAGLRDIILSQGGDDDYWTKNKCEDLIEEWFKIYKGVRTFFNETVNYARKHSYVRDIFGRIRWVAGIHSQDEYMREEAARQACNAVIQGGTAGVIKRSMCGIQPVIKEFRGKVTVCDPLLQIHDALLFEVSKKVAVPFAKRLANLMENVVELRVPITAQADIGPSWGDMKEFNERDTEEWEKELILMEDTEGE